MDRGFKYRLYPSDDQKKWIHRCFAVRCRMWNALHAQILKMIEESEDGKFDHKLAAMRMRAIKNDPGNEWMKEVHSAIGEYVTIRYKRSWSAFFSKLKSGEVKAKAARKIARWKALGKPVNQKILDKICKPDFISIKDPAQSFQIRGSDCHEIEECEKWGLVSFKGSGGRIKFRLHRPLVCERVRTVTISRKASGKFFISFNVVDNVVAPGAPKKPGNVISLDSSIVGFTTQEGFIYAHPMSYKANQKRLSFLQQKLARQEKGSKRHDKTKQQIAKLYERITNIRNDFLHKTSNEITSLPEFDGVSVEVLSISKMMQKPLPIPGDKVDFMPNGATESTRMARLMADLSQSRFRDFLKYKAAWNGKKFIAVDPKNYTNRTCSNCGKVNDHVHYKMKTWTCSNCNETHGKYLNGSKVIENLSSGKKYAGK